MSDLEALVDSKTDLSDYPNATEIQQNIVIYDSQRFLEKSRREILSELNHCLLSGPGVFIVRSLYARTEVLDKATEAFIQIITEEREEAEKLGQIGGDHFGTKSSNERVWNSFQKLARLSPELFYEYFSNPLLDLICEAWLGPFYRMTTQLNVVKPGGQAQTPHRDYHLGFQPVETAARFPIAAHNASQLLTLQGAVAHVDMPVESGPTMVLPYSQLYELGYLALQDPSFAEFFEKRRVQLPMCKGDGIFFSPALLHAAGTNRSKDVRRMVNLLQVSSCMGKPMESVDANPSIANTYDIMLREYEKAGKKMTPELETFVHCVADGYPFPSNLDTSPPDVDGKSASNDHDIIFLALERGLPRDKMLHLLIESQGRRLASAKPMLNGSSSSA